MLKAIISSLLILKSNALSCPEGTEQVGALNADIAGCGLEGCDARYQDRYPTIEDCVEGCESNINCVSFTWAPLNGDKNHQGKSVCTLYNSDAPNQVWSPNQIMCRPTLQCPNDYEQVGGINSDIAGCGLEGCNARYQDSYQSIEDCINGCDSRSDCKSFTWAPLDGDRNHPGKTVCTLYNSDIPNQSWSPRQIMCKKPLLECPVGTEQIGAINADIAGCGLEGCNARYQDNYGNINDCLSGCSARADCESFTWASLNGDRNHPGKTVCTLYDSDEPNQLWSPNQIMCRPLDCPDGYEQVGGINADIAGCGLEGCDARYQDNYVTMDDCIDGCESRADCLSFTWAPLNGDRNHPGKTVCTLYNGMNLNRQWSPNQIMCKKLGSCESDLDCGANENCEVSECKCDSGYKGDPLNGVECKLDTQWMKKNKESLIVRFYGFVSSYIA